LAASGLATSRFDGGTLTTRHKLRQISTCIYVVVYLLLLSAASMFAQANQESGDGYVRRAGNEWIFGTSKVEQRVRLADGHFSLVSLRNKVSGRKYQAGAGFRAEIVFLANGRGVGASNWHWNLRGDHIATGTQGGCNSTLKLNQPESESPNIM
jgi:hypothetical protein